MNRERLKGVNERSDIIKYVRLFWSLEATRKVYFLCDQTIHSFNFCTRFSDQTIKFKHLVNCEKFTLVVRYTSTYKLLFFF